MYLTNGGYPRRFGRLYKRTYNNPDLSLADYLRQKDLHAFFALFFAITTIRDCRRRFTYACSCACRARIVRPDISRFGGDINSGGAVSLHNPSAVVVDAAGNTYVSDTSNSRIVEFDAHGVASVLTGNIFISDTGSNRIVEVTQGASRRL
jgi:hypothetical protein